MTPTRHDGLQPNVIATTRAPIESFAPVRLDLTISSGEQLETVNHAAAIPVSLGHLPKRAIHLDIAGSQSEALSVWTTESRHGFVSRPKAPADLVTLRFVDHGAMSWRGRKNRDVAIAPNQALFSSFDELRMEQMTPGFSAITATIDPAAVLAAQRSLDCTRSSVLLRFSPIVAALDVGMLSLRHTLGRIRQHMLSGSNDADLMTPLLQELLVYQFISVWPKLEDPFDIRTSQGHDRCIDAATDFIDAHLGRKIGVLEIANAAGVSVRTLQDAFKRRLSCGPVQYLIERRLDKVHAALQANAGVTVRAVALEWGFTHMGDFNGRYRDRFGHTPGGRTPLYQVNKGHVGTAQARIGR